MLNDGEVLVLLILSSCEHRASEDLLGKLAFPVGRKKSAEMLIDDKSRLSSPEALTCVDCPILNDEFMLSRRG